MVINIFQFYMHTLYVLFPFHPGFQGKIDFILMRKVQIQLYSLSKQGGTVPRLVSFATYKTALCTAMPFSASLFEDAGLGKVVGSQP